MELVQGRRSTVDLHRPAGGTVDVEQPSLGTVGVDSFSLALDWHWEGGWTLRSSTRLSGSTSWVQHSYEALTHDEALQVLQEVAAEALGLV